MKRTLLTLLVLLIVTVPAKAQLTAKVTFNPSSPLPGDHVRGYLTIYTSTPERISGVTFYSSLQITPRDVSGIGTLPANSEYTIPFTLVAPSPGVYTIKAYISTTNGSVLKTFNLNVVSAKPQVVITTPITLGEVNDVQFVLYNPINAIDVKVTPLFKAYPSEIAVLNGRGGFEFYPENATPLKFRIEFYNGFADNYHSYVQTVYPSYRESKGVVLNVSIPHSSYLTGDVIPVKVEVANLRGDSIYSVKVKLTFYSYTKTLEIPSIAPGEKSAITIDCPALKSGVVKINVTYKDGFGNSYSLERSMRVNVSPQKTLSISDVSVERSENGFEVTGDVSNSGWSKAYSVTVTAVGRKNSSYFIGTIDPSDYDTFDLVASNATKLVVTWQNGLGETFSNSYPLTLHSARKVVVKENSSSIVVAAVGAVIIVLLAVLGVMRARKGR